VTLAGRYDALFIDLDGVVYRGDQAIPAAAHVLPELRRAGPSLLFLTNNSARTPDQVAEKLRGLGVQAEPKEVLTSALATAALLRKEGAAGGTAFVIGERGVREALQTVGIQLVDGEPDRADLVVVGWDRTVDYAKLRTASLLVERGARLIATNADASYPAREGLWPGAGALLAVVTTTTGAHPTVVGKPSSPLFQAAAEATGATRPLVVGDRLDTDVGGAAAMGWDSLLVWTGAARPADLLAARTLPTYVGEDLSVLLDERPPGRFRPATDQDVEPLREMLEGSGLRSNGLERRLSRTLVSRGSDRRSLVDATACLEELDGFGLLRSVAVRPDLRGKGLGMLATAAAVREARSLGASRLFLLTETAEGFFKGLGFSVIERHTLPGAVRTNAHAVEECPSAVAMAIDLQP
jgi:glycerol 3-phosphatase-2